MITMFGALCLPGTSTTYAANQTPTVTPVQNGGLGFNVEINAYDMGATPVPTLHSFASGEVDGKWVIIGGRTNGMHGFENIGVLNFPEATANRNVWVIDPVTKQTWSRSLEDVSSGFDGVEIASLSTTNNQYQQVGDTLYMTGGYGVSYVGSVFDYETFDRLTAIDLTGLADWVINGTGAAADHVRQISDPMFKVTGGAMYELGGQMQLVFGQDFNGTYTPGTNGTYTQQVRRFEIVDDGVNLSVTNTSATTPAAEYRRRDLNVIPVNSPDGLGGINEGIVALSGVFTATNGAWTVPVEIGATGEPTMDDPNDPDTFKQAMNGYHSAKLGLYSEASGDMVEFLFGGITYAEYDEVNDTLITSNQLPNTSQISAVKIDASGEYSQHYMGAFPEVYDLSSNLVRYGSNAEFFPAPGVQLYDNGVIKLDELQPGDLLGWIYGGIAANAPHVRQNPNGLSGASNTLWEVIYRPEIVGDLNGDGFVGIADLNIVLGNWNQNVTPGDPLVGDPSGDGFVGIADLNQVLGNWNAGTPPTNNVPEPASAALLLSLSLTSLNRRRT
ncbi:MAG: hypothetical protein R3C45_15855 [Phycisphaerales bacterium]